MEQALDYFSKTDDISGTSTVTNRFLVIYLVVSANESRIVRVESVDHRQIVRGASFHCFPPALDHENSTLTSSRDILHRRPISTCSLN